MKRMHRRWVAFALAGGLMVGLRGFARATSVLYVDASSAEGGNGASWPAAFRDLQTAVQAAPPGSSLWVAAGDYVPGAERTNAFVLNNIALYGGFTNGMQTIKERDWEAHPTTLSGEIGNPGLRGDNIHRIILVVSNVTVDGFTLTRAYNDGPAVDPRNPAANEGQRGGAISAIFNEMLWMHAAPLTIRNCRFIDNRAGAGGAIRLGANAYLWTNHTEAVLIENCSFIDNQAIGGGPLSEGGAIHLGSGNDKIVVRNCLFFDNSADWGGAVSMQYTVGNTPSRFERCTFHGNTSANGKAIVLRFQDARLDLYDSIVWNAGADQIHLKDNSHLRVGFACVEGGLGTVSVRSGSSLTRLGSVLTGDPRFADVAVGDLHLRSQAGRWTPGGWVVDAETSPAIAAGDPNTDYAREPEPNGHRVNLGAYGNTVQASKAYSPGVLYVDANVPPGGNGLTWETALSTVQAALMAANSGQEIWVAEGRYTPGTQRTDSFHLVHGVNVFGGFTNGMTDFTMRNWRRHVTVLSGDLLGDDASNWSNRADNGYHVVIGANALLDGVAIVGGHADGDWDTAAGRGGGVLGTGGAPVLRHCVLAGNSAATGGAVFWDGADAQVLDCVFSGNRGTDEDGGAGAAGGRNGSLARFRRCVFAGNEMLGRGGVMYTGTSPWSCDFVNCLLVGNVSWLGTGGLDFRLAQPPPSVINCTFFGALGSSLNIQDTAAIVRNSILWGASGSEIGVSGTPLPVITHNNIDQAGYAGLNQNLRADPQFLSEGTGAWSTTAVFRADQQQTVLTAAGASWAPGVLAGLALQPNTNSSVHFVIHDNDAESLSLWGDATALAQGGETFRIRDFRLNLRTSPCVDVGTFQDAPADDLAGIPRPQGAAPDMGAHEASLAAQPATGILLNIR